MDKALFFRFLASLALCDHMGEVHEAVEHVLKLSGLYSECIGEFDSFEVLLDKLAAMDIKTLYGTSLGPRG